MAFVLSLDDFVITNFVAGQATTFPLWVFGAQRIGFPPQVNVMGTLLFGAGCSPPSPTSWCSVGGPEGVPGQTPEAS